MFCPLWELPAMYTYLPTCPGEEGEEEGEEDEASRSVRTTRHSGTAHDLQALPVITT